MNKQKIRVLVVDDDKLMRDVLKAILRDEGYTVAGEASNGENALALCDKAAPDVVCLDVNMPGMTGLEVLKTLRKRCPDTKVVMITGDASMSTVREAVGLGAMGYIIKPFNVGRVADSLKACLSAGSNPFGQ
jgi:two-component system chemotaxis response regulator CheY